MLLCNTKFRHDSCCQLRLTTIYEENYASVLTEFLKENDCIAELQRPSGRRAVGLTAGGPLAGKLSMPDARANDICSGFDCVLVSCECARAPAKVATTDEISEIGPVMIPVSRPVASFLYLEDYLIAFFFTGAWASAIYIAYTS